MYLLVIFKVYMGVSAERGEVRCGQWSRTRGTDTRWGCEQGQTDAANAHAHTKLSSCNDGWNEFSAAARRGKVIPEQERLQQCWQRSPLSSAWLRLCLKPGFYSDTPARGALAGPEEGAAGEGTGLSFLWGTCSITLGTGDDLLGPKEKHLNTYLSRKCGKCCWHE